MSKCRCENRLLRETGFGDAACVNCGEVVVGRNTPLVALERRIEDLATDFEERISDLERRIPDPVVEEQYREVRLRERAEKAEMLACALEAFTKYEQSLGRAEAMRKALEAAGVGEYE